MEVREWVAAGVVDLKAQNDFEGEKSKDNIPEWQQQYIGKGSLASEAAGGIGGRTRPGLGHVRLGFGRCATRLRAIKVDNKKRFY